MEHEPDLRLERRFFIVVRQKFDLAGALFRDSRRSQPRCGGRDRVFVAAFSLPRPPPTIFDSLFFKFVESASIAVRMYTRSLLLPVFFLNFDSIVRGYENPPIFPVNI